LLEHHDEDPYAVLAEHRAWGRDQGLFNGFPADVAWFRAALTTAEVRGIRCMNWDWWLRITDGTRKPRDTAARVRAGLVPE